MDQSGSEDSVSENEVREALNLLFQLLRKAFEQPPQTVRDSRGQYIVALHDLAKFLKLLGAGRDIAQRFLQLALVLFDVQHGAQPELLRVTRPGGRPLDPTDVWMVRSHAAVALEWFVRSGMHPSDAAKEIVKRCPEIDRAVRDDARNAETSLLYWHKALGEKSPKNDIAIDIFHEGLETVNILTPQLSTADRQAAGMRLVMQLGELAVGLTGKSQTP